MLTLERVCGRVGYPNTISVDNVSEFCSRDLELRAHANDVKLDFSRPGKPTDKDHVQAFNSKLRAECLKVHWFMSLADARGKLEVCRGYVTTADHAVRPKTRSRLLCIILMASPARHREKDG